MEELQAFSEAPLVKCPQCHLDTLARVIGGGGGLIFKGTGFYLTDYKKSSKASESKAKVTKDDKKADASATPAPAPESKPSSGDSKSPASPKE